jgi:hypothetical protein
VVDARTICREDVVAAADTPRYTEVRRTVWRSDEQALSLAQRCLALYHARWRAGTLFTLSPQELAYFTDRASLPAKR